MSYAAARQQYLEWGVDPEPAIAAALAIPISVHCWQGDDVRGFEGPLGGDGGGILATGAHPGAARNGDELRADLDFVWSVCPGTLRLNLHAMYAEIGRKVERNAIDSSHFASWMHWSTERQSALDFNPTYFAHPLAAGGTLSHADSGIRSFWVEHGLACRRIAADFAKGQSGICIHNHWIPDGEKDSPMDRWGPRARLTESLDTILTEPIPSVSDTVESKLFGLGSEDYVVGSFEYYSHYALTREIGFCLDMGHFHPTETIHDKISSLLQFHQRLLIHASRPMRWDSDHVVIDNDDLGKVFQEIHRGEAWNRVWIALDFFDASISRVMAYGVGIRATRRAILRAMLEPTQRLKNLAAGPKLAVLEEVKLLPFGEVWSELLRRADCPGSDWIERAKQYDARVTSLRT